MTYAQEAIKLGKQAVQIVELHMDRCSLTYGVAPCTAVLGTTGTKKCYNTFSTCQSAANYTIADSVYRFATTRVDGLQAVGEFPTFPTLIQCTTAPTVLTPGKGIGVRAALKVTIQDHPWVDVGMDPYPTSRSLPDPDTFGSFWGRFIARNRYYTGRRIVVKTGFLDDNGQYQAANFISRTYVITKLSGPDAHGKVSIEAKDPLKFADSEKVKFPFPSTAVLVGDITTTDTTITISDPGGMVVDALASGQSYLRVDKEIINVTGYSTVGTTITATVLRAGNPASVPAFYNPDLNPQSTHSDGATVQQTYLFNNSKVYDVVYKLLGPTVAGLPTAYLPLSEWTSYFEPNFSYMSFSRLLAEPTGVKDLLTELSQHGLLLWWDERRAIVQLKPMRYYGLLSATATDTNSIIKDSVATSEDPSGLITQVWFTYAHACPLEDPRLLKSYRSAVVKVDTDAESSAGYGTPTVNTIYSRWLPLTRASDVSAMSQTFLRQYSKIRRVVTWAMDPKDDVNWVGDVVGFQTRQLQDTEGNLTPINVLITSVEEVYAADGVTLKYTATEQFAFSRVGLIGPNTLPDYSSASSVQKAGYAFICRDIPTTGPTFADGTPAYQIQ